MARHPGVYDPSLSGVGLYSPALNGGGLYDPMLLVIAGAAAETPARVVTPVVVKQAVMRSAVWSLIGFLLTLEF